MGIKRQQLVYAALCIFLFGLYKKSDYQALTRERISDLPPNHQKLQDQQMTDMIKAVIKLKERIDILSDNILKQAAQTKQLAGAQKQQHIPKKTYESRVKDLTKYAEQTKLEFLQKRNYSNQFVNGKLVSSKGKKVQIIMLVGSTARSGTSFLGELLAQFDNFLYLFEPELYVRVATTEMLTEQYGIPHLRDMINCRFTDRFILWLKTRASSFNCFRHPITKTNCRNWETCLTIPRLTEACQGEDIRILKVIRVRMSWMRTLLDDPHIDLKVIHLVRDPRGSLYSMAKYHLHKLEPGYYCPMIEEDITETPKLMEKYPGKVMGLTYEQLCLDPMGKAKEIWRFLAGDRNAEMPSKWSTYMETHMSRTSQNRKVPVYSTYRNTTEQYQAWRNDITDYALKEIEANCKGVLKLLGYNLFGSLENAKNANISLFVNPPDK
ncbi:hypothetical protein SK128_024310 [Halocaridina rubra]|uniref:Sulfotransferase domain-containing protein n=1 Tax=Halocaridina rubra TaxID=373956 RepID=A0AAN8X0R9_HALRR